MIAKIALLLSFIGCSAQNTAIKQARIDFPKCDEPRYVGEWQNEIELRVCGVIPVATDSGTSAALRFAGSYEVTPIGGARRTR